MKTKIIRITLETIVCVLVGLAWGYWIYIAA